MKVLCFYHANCMDGVAAACAVLFRYPEAVCIPMNYHDPLPEFEDQDLIFIVDFSFQVDVTEKIISKTSRLIWIDHHEVDELVDPILVRHGRGDYGHTHVAVYYNKKVSGAYATWCYMLDGDEEKIPEVVRYISDRDLWEFKEPDSRAVSLALGTYPLDIETYQTIINVNTGWDRVIIEDLKSRGRNIKRYHDQMLSNVISSTIRLIKIDGVEVPLINCPYMLVSEALERLCETYPYAVSYFDTPTVRKYSIRSKKDSGPNVKLIAAKFGGGGHYHASGWVTAIDEPILS